MAPPIREHRAGLAKPLGCRGLHCLLGFLALTLCAHFFARRTPTLSALSSMLRDQCIQDSSNAFLTQVHLPSHLFPLSLFFEAEPYGESKLLAIGAAVMICYCGGSKHQHLRSSPAKRSADGKVPSLPHVEGFQGKTFISNAVPSPNSNHLHTTKM